MTGTRQAHRLAAVAVAVALLLLGLAPAAGASGSAESSFVAKLNAERTQRGLPALGADAQLTRVARDWTAQMAADGAISHRPNLRAAVSDDAARVGENVGRSVLTGAAEAQLVERIHRAFMESPGHRQNVLGDWTHVGVGVQTTDGGSEMWVTVNFKAVAPQQPQPKPEPETKAEPGTKPEPLPGPEPQVASGQAVAEPPSPPDESAPQPAGAEVAGAGGEPGGEVTAEDVTAAHAAQDGVARLVSTARGALSPAIRAHFALNATRPLLQAAYAMVV